MITFSWAGKLDAIDGTATFKINGRSYEFWFESFEVANKIYELMRMNFTSGRISGVEEARRRMLCGLDSIDL
jgi:hypothetical protein